MKAKKFNKLLKDDKGFTLIELVVVLAILAILVMIAIPVFGNTTENARVKVDDANLRTAQSALQLYIAESGDDDLSEVSTVEDLKVEVTYDGKEYGPYLPDDFETEPQSKEYKEKGYTMIVSGTDVEWGTPSS
ncbi:MAG: type II secretion system protein [Clostridia bacterium]|nr:type II secretion system protein [Clostridia bacterium]